MGNKPMLKIQRRVVESIFSEKEISEKFEKLINSTYFIRYKEIILSKCKEEAEMNGILFDEKRKEDISYSIISILKIAIFKIAIEECKNKKTELKAEICSLFEMPIARRCLHWLRTRAGAYQLCKSPKMLEEYNLPFELKQSLTDTQDNCMQWIATANGAVKLLE